MYSVGMAQTPSWHISFVNLNSNSLLSHVAETLDDVDIHNFDQFIAALGTKYKPRFSYSLQVNIKVNSYAMKVIDYYSDKRHSEVSAEELSCQWGICRAARLY